MRNMKSIEQAGYTLERKHNRHAVVHLKFLTASTTS